MQAPWKGIGMQLGIDFGTTRTAVAVLHEGNLPNIHFAVPGEESHEWYPSVVVEREGRLFFGLDALAYADQPGCHTQRSFKRWLSDPQVSMQSTAVLGRVVIRIVDLIVGFLQALHADLLSRASLPRRLKKGEGFQVVIAVPAHAHSAQRMITLEAFRQAGFEVVGMMNEPSAAGLEFARRFFNTFSSKREKVAIYDLGGGTFDASVVDMGQDAHQVKASAGHPRLGGDDFDLLLREMALKEAKIQLKQLSERSQGLFLLHCREQKERLHPNSKTLNLELAANLDQVDRTIAGLAEDSVVTVSTQRYYQAVAPLIDESIQILEAALVAAAEDDEAPLETVAAVYVVGGASALPAVGRQLRARYGRRIRRTLYPSAATAMGLALAHDAAPEFRVEERLARYFGVFREADSGRQVAFDPILSPRTLVPAIIDAEPKVTTRRYRPVHNIGHYRFLECSELDAHRGPSGDITPFWEIRFPFERALQAPGVALKDEEVGPIQGEAPLIEEEYRVDASGVLSLSIRDLSSGYEASYP